MALRAKVLLSAFLFATVGFVVPRLEPAIASNIITVNSTLDGPDSNDSNCTLREAVESANADLSPDGDCADGSGTDTINFSPAIDTQAITLSGPVDILTPVTITGNGRTKTIV